MLQSIQSQALSSASVKRSVAVVSAQIAQDAVVATANFYYGYWFSHWRA